MSTASKPGLPLPGSWHRAVEFWEEPCLLQVWRQFLTGEQVLPGYACSWPPCAIRLHLMWELFLSYKLICSGQQSVWWLEEGGREASLLPPAHPGVSAGPHCSAQQIKPANLPLISVLAHFKVSLSRSNLQFSHGVQCAHSHLFSATSFSS